MRPTEYHEQVCLRIPCLRQCLDQKRATFIALENKWFQDTALFDGEFKQQNRVELVTQIRNPLDRYVSNYFFDCEVAKNFHEPLAVKQLPLIQRLKRWHSHGHYAGEASMWNMYVRVLSNQKERDRTVTDHELETAKTALDQFDLVVVLEMPDAAALWNGKYGMRLPHLKGVLQRIY